MTSIIVLKAWSAEKCRSEKFCRAIFIVSQSFFPSLFFGISFVWVIVIGLDWIKTTGALTNRFIFANQLGCPMTHMLGIRWFKEKLNHEHDIRSGHNLLPVLVIYVWNLVGDKTCLNREPNPTGDQIGRKWLRKKRGTLYSWNVTLLSLSLTLFYMKLKPEMYSVFNEIQMYYSEVEVTILCIISVVHRSLINFWSIPDLV